MSKFPKDNQAALIKFYGDPGTPAVSDQLVRITPPFKMYYEGKPVKTLTFHKKAAPALLAALNKIWDYYDHDQSLIDKYEISKYSGTYNPRLVRNSKTKWSNHAYGAAIDIDAEDNGFGTGKGDLPAACIAAFKSEGFSWGGDYKGRTDPMHFEACDRGEPELTFEQWLTKLGGSKKNADVPQPFLRAIGEDFESEPKPEPVKPPAPVAEKPTARPTVQGDPELFALQSRLKVMNYNPGITNGVWGGMMSGAISGFTNDRHLDLPAPTSLEMFNVVREQLKIELSRAEAENWKRPVSPERASGDTKVVAQVAPEVMPVKRNFLVTAWGAAVTFFVGLWNAVSDKITGAWDFFTDHKDDLPTDPGILQTAWGYVGKVPTSVWIILGGFGLVLIAVNSFKTVNRITATVQTGERQ